MTNPASSLVLDLENIPEALTDAEARALLDMVAPRAKKINDDVVRNNTRAEQGQAQMATLMARAREHFKTESIDEMRKILNDRMMNNARVVREHIAAVKNTEQSLMAVANPTALSQPGPGR